MNIDKVIKNKQHAKRCGNLHQLAKFTKILGDMYFENEQPEKALQEYIEQLSVCENLQDGLNCAIAHRMIGEVYASLGNYEQALVHQNLYLEGAKNMKNLIEEQRAFATLGRTYFCLAESFLTQSQKHNEALANAKTAYVKSMELCDKLTEADINLKEKILMRARLHLNLGLTLEAQKEVQQAIDLMEQATALCITNNFEEDLHRTYIALAATYERRGNHELALNYCDKAATAKDICLNAEAKLSKVELLMRIGQWIESRKILVSLYKSSGLSRNINRQVEKYLRIVVTICRTEYNLLVETNIQTKQKLYEILGDAAVALQCFNKGAEYYQHMLSCAEETNNEIDVALISLTQTLKDAGRCKEALPFAQRELQLCSNPREKCRSARFIIYLLTATDATDIEIREYYAIAFNAANAESDNIKLQRSIAKDFVRYLENRNHFDEAKNMRERTGLTSETLSDTESETSNEESEEIGTDICLEYLSDLETEENVKEVNVTGRRKGKKVTAIKRNEKGETQLHVACINGNIDAVEKLLSSGHPINVRDHCGWTPLHETANHGHVEIAELLLNHGASINDPGGISCKGVTPLHDAACCGHFSMMQLLMQHGANIMLKTHDGDTVLDYLEEWRDRVKDLDPADLVEYEIVHKKLSAILVKKKKSDNIQKIDKNQPEISKISSAGEDYKRTIANLRTFNKVKSVAAFKNDNSPVTSLLSEEQIVVDDWLEDDIGSTKKRKSISSNYTTINKRKSVEDIENITKKLKRKDIFQSEDLKTDEESIDSTDIEVVQLLEESESTGRKRQASLLSSGFTMSHISSPVHLQSSLHASISPKEYTEEYINVQILVKEKLFNVKVNVCEDEKQFLTYITNILEHQFLNETGCTAKLLLQQINEIAITKENILKIARENNKLECEIVELQIPPIVERYKTICCTYNITPYEIVLRCLKSCENTSIFRVKSDDMSKEQLIPLLKTLEYQKDVKLLQLSGTVLLAAGVHLNQCFSNLSSLQELYLKSCDIDFACLHEINSLPSQLRILDLSYNPLSSKSRETLQKLIAPLRYLQTLNLRYCELEDLCPPLNIPTLMNCDISWNRLNCDTMNSFSSRQLFDLNLSNTSSLSKQLALNLDTTSTVLSGLESLELAFCNLTDSDVKIILAQLPRLSKLVLSGNTNVSLLSVNVLLSRRPTLIYIDVSGCKNIVTNPEAELVIQNPEICTLLVSMEPDLCDSWIKLWRGTCIVTKLPHNLTIFKPI